MKYLAFFQPLVCFITTQLLSSGYKSMLLSMLILSDHLCKEKNIIVCLNTCILMLCIIAGQNTQTELKINASEMSWIFSWEMNFFNVEGGIKVERLDLYVNVCGFLMKNRKKQRQNELLDNFCWQRPGFLWLWFSAGSQKALKPNLKNYLAQVKLFSDWKAIIPCKTSKKAVAFMEIEI